MTRVGARFPCVTHRGKTGASILAGKKVNNHFCYLTSGTS
ncbi:hypothetical protein HMPREF0577_0415 [Mobiluncus mulieris ATCC 35243]|nr:hypothetical protein HMPREF0577_0415 [Mobiluncus mulieris ATCC 35243]